MELQQYSRLVLDLHEASRALAPVAFQDWAIARLRRDLPFTSARWSLGALSDDDILHSACYGTRPDFDRELHAIREQDDIRQRMINDVGVTAIKSGDSDDRFLRRFDQRHELHSLLATAVPDASGKLLQVLSLYRSDSAPLFTDDERMLKQMLAPHLMQAWQGSWSYAPLTLDEPQALLSFDGFVIDAEPRFSAMLRAAWPSWCGRRIVLTAGGFDGPASATAKVCIVPVPGGAPGTQRVLIRANRCGVLTARERAVAAHYAAGLSYKEIAKALGISPDTVRSYIKCCYAKLEVCNKVQLQAALGAA
jgi:DNA-binding CsgD family transcriptional regulator